MSEDKTTEEAKVQNEEAAQPDEAELTVDSAARIDQAVAAADEAAESSAASDEEPEDAPTDAVADELQKLQEERDEIYQRYLRSVADLDTYRRRVLREKDELRKFAIGDLVESLIPVIENLGLASQSAQQTDDPKTIATGVSMVLEQFRSSLGAVGLEEIAPKVGDDFDPHQQESLSHAPSDDIDAEKIVQIVRIGYSLNGRIIRPANVVLSSGPAASTDKKKGKKS